MEVCYTCTLICGGLSDRISQTSTVNFPIFFHHMICKHYWVINDNAVCRFLICTSIFLHVQQRWLRLPAVRPILWWIQSWVQSPRCFPHCQCRKKLDHSLSSSTSLKGEEKQNTISNYISVFVPFKVLNWLHLWSGNAGWMSHSPCC